MRIIRTHHVAITTSQFELLRAFYVELLGLPVVGGFPEHDIVFLDAGGTTVELLGEQPATRPGVDTGKEDRAQRFGWHHLALQVDDVDAAYAELIAAGVAPHSEPESFPPADPSLRIAFLRDPDGNLLELIQPLSIATA
jgi:catechol 2,3-dioxygenase-like lactoylglutathione lyase family enzyme